MVPSSECVGGRPLRSRRPLLKIDNHFRKRFRQFPLQIGERPEDIKNALESVIRWRLLDEPGVGRSGILFLEQQIHQCQVRRGPIIIASWSCELCLDPSTRLLQFFTQRERFHIFTKLAYSVNEQRVWL